MQIVDWLYIFWWAFSFVRYYYCQILTSVQNLPLRLVMKLHKSASTFLDHFSVSARVDMNQTEMEIAQVRVVIDFVEYNYCKPW